MHKIGTNASFALAFSKTCRKTSLILKIRIVRFYNQNKDSTKNVALHTERVTQIFNMKKPSFTFESFEKQKKLSNLKIDDVSSTEKLRLLWNNQEIFENRINKKTLFRREKLEGRKSFDEIVNERMLYSRSANFNLIRTSESKIEFKRDKMLKSQISKNQIDKENQKISKELELISIEKRNSRIFKNKSEKYITSYKEIHSFMKSEEIDELKKAEKALKNQKKNITKSGSEKEKSPEIYKNERNKENFKYRDLGWKNKSEIKEEKEQIGVRSIIKRPPIICVMGHVDHGKTSLIDYLRKSKMAQKEVGGITQIIGAFALELPGNKRLTMIDTPGHEAFSAMRTRGASIVDGAIIVIAANEGVQPMTRQSIRILKENKKRFIVAITKCDLNTANVKKVHQQLTTCGVYSEELGGTTTVMNVSSKTGKGMDLLIEMAHLEAIMEEPTANVLDLAEASVLEVTKKKTGIELNCIITNGTLRPGDWIAVGEAYGKVKRIYDQYGQEIDAAEPVAPVVVTGLRILPEKSLELYAFKEEKLAKNAAEKSLQILQAEKAEIGSLRTKELKLKDELVKDKEVKVEDKQKVSHELRMTRKEGRAKARDKFLARVKEEKSAREVESKNVVLFMKVDNVGALETTKNIINSVFIFFVNVFYQIYYSFF